MPQQFSAIILALGGSIFPITSSIPVHLIPIANRPLLAYQLDLLEDVGLSEVLVVTVETLFEAIQAFCSEERREKLDIRVLAVDDDHSGSADVIRTIAAEIKNDFIVLFGDLISEKCLIDAVNLHKVESACATMLLQRTEPDAKKGGKPAPTFDDCSDCFGIVSNSTQVVLIQDFDQLVEEVKMPKGILSIFPRIDMSSSFKNPQVFIFSHWVLGEIQRHEELCSIQSDVIPRLLKLQLEPQLASIEDSATATSDLASSVKFSKPEAQSISHDGEMDKKRNGVHAHFLPAKHICFRVNSAEALLYANQKILTSRSPFLPWTPPVISSEQRTCVVGEGLEVGNKVSVKLCSIGSGVTIGEKSKLNNCVVLDGVTIGSSCIIQNCVIGVDAAIGDGCNLNECQIGSEVVVEEPGVKLRGEQFTKAEW